MSENPLTAHGRLHLERLKLAADVLLSECDDIPDSLEVELHALRRADRTRPPVPGWYGDPAERDARHMTCRSASGTRPLVMGWITSE